MIILFLFLVKISQISITPRFWWPFLFALIFTASLILQIRLLRQTLGESIWHLRSDQGPFWNRKLLQVQAQSSRNIIVSLLVTSSVVLVAYLYLRQNLFMHPIWIQGQSENIASAFPSLKNEDWVISPFFFSMGAWPRTFQGKPVFYTIPYEKGPPQNFIGHLIGRWETPDVKLVIEGPKTPILGLDRERIRNCIQPGNGDFFQCLPIREKVLERHVSEIQNTVSQNPTWSLKWATVENNALSPEQRTQGIYLSAHDGIKAVDRLVLITPQGTHQSVTLHYPRTPMGMAALQLFQTSIRSLQTSDDLAPGKAWIDQQLEYTRMSELKKIEDPLLYVSQLADIQSHLVSRISVDPRLFEAYFHLGGTALLLAQQAQKVRKTHSALSAEWSAVARQQLSSIIQYARDLAPKDPRVQELQRYFLDASK